MQRNQLRASCEDASRHFVSNNSSHSAGDRCPAGDPERSSWIAVVALGNSSSQKITFVAIYLLISALVFTVLGIGRSFASEMAPSEMRMLKDLQFLASDELEGRGSGDIGLEVAADYLKDQFKLAGLTLPEQDEDGFLEFNINRRATLGSPNKVTLSDTQGWSDELRLNQNFIPMSLGGSGSFSGEVVFCGYGIDAPSLNYSDFENIDLQGKIALILRKAPRQDQGMGETPFLNDQGVLIPDYASFKSKIEQAEKHGAIAVIIVNDLHYLSKQKERIEIAIETAQEKLIAEETSGDRKDRLESTIDQLKASIEEGKYDDLLRYGFGGTTDSKIPVFQMKSQTAQTLFDKADAGRLDEIQTEIDKTLQPHSFALENVKIEGMLTLNSSQAQVKNVIAVLEGEGPLADETIIIGAHYDHVGRGEYGSLSGSRGDIHNGSDDNASGTILLMELARKLGARQEKLPRRLVFIGFAAEEMGLLGSKAYCSDPLYPAKNTIAMLNFDMVGRVSDNRVVAFGTKSSSRWEPLLDDLESRYKLHIVRQPPGRGPSDHQSFFDIGIPVLHFFSGLHGDYHTPADDWEKINISGINELVDLTADAVVQLATQKERPDFVKVSGSADVHNAAAGYPFLGTIHDRSYTEGYRVQQVIPDSPAARAGMKPSDIITAIGDVKISSPLEFSQALAKRSNTSSVPVTVQRGDEVLTLAPTLQVQPN